MKTVHSHRGLTYKSAWKTHLTINWVLSNPDLLKASRTARFTRRLWWPLISMALTLPNVHESWREKVRSKSRIEVCRCMEEWHWRYLKPNVNIIRTLPMPHAKRVLKPSRWLVRAFWQVELCPYISSEETIRISHWSRDTGPRIARHKTPKQRILVI